MLCFSAISSILSQSFARKETRMRLKYTRHEDLAIRPLCTVGRQEYVDHMTFQTNERPLFTEIFGPLIGLKEEWEQQGATAAELDLSAFNYRCPAFVTVQAACGFFGGPPEQTIEETDEHRIYRDSMGRLMKLPKNYATLAHPMEYPVATMDDWLKIKSHFLFDPRRLAEGWQKSAAQAREADKVLRLQIPGGFDAPRTLMGEEGVCIAYYEQPELVADILATICQTTLAVLDAVTREIVPDVLFIHEDMAGKSGPLAGPSQITQFIAPYYRKVWELASARGIRLFDQDSDGDMNAVIEYFVDAGVNCMHPFEPAAGMDVVKTRQKFGKRLACYGGIDKHVLRKDRAAIDAELEYKIPPMVASGGCMLALDHRIPNGTSLENYRHYVAKTWEIMNREAAKL
jgi:hypothetical protein